MHSKIDAIIGANVRRARAAVGINQEKLGLHLAISAQQVSKFELGTNRISASQLVEIASVCGTTVTELVQGVASEIPAESLGFKPAAAMMRDLHTLTPGTRAIIRDLVRAIILDTARRMKP